MNCKEKIWNSSENLNSKLTAKYLHGAFFAILENFQNFRKNSAKFERFKHWNILEFIYKKRRKKREKNSLKFLDLFLDDHFDRITENGSSPKISTGSQETGSLFRIRCCCFVTTYGNICINCPLAWLYLVCNWKC